MRLKVIGANVRFKWQTGKHNLIADVISRFPVSPKEPMDSAEMEEDRAYNWRTITSNNGGLKWLCDAADKDTTYKEVVKAKCSGPPSTTCPSTTPPVRSETSAISSAWRKELDLHFSSMTALTLLCHPPYHMPPAPDSAPDSA